MISNSRKKDISIISIIKKFSNKYPFLYVIVVVITMLKLMIWHSSYINFEWTCKINWWEFNKEYRICKFEDKNFGNLKDFSDYIMNKYWIMTLG